MKVLISMQAPQNASPYVTIAEANNLQIDFIPFFLIEPLSSREFRAQRITLSDYTAVVFASRHAIDAYFHMCEEQRFKVPETMKYFCTTEAIANYLQKHIVYRKRKIFFGTGTPASVLATIGPKHKGEKFLIATSGSTVSEMTKAFETAGLNFAAAEFVKPVSQDIRNVDIDSYDVAVLYNTADVISLQENHPGFKAGHVKFITFGRSIVKAMEEAGLEIAISAPTPEAPSALKALEIFAKKSK